MLTTLLFDFSRVLAFPKTSGDAETVSQAYHNPHHATDAFSAFLNLNNELIEFVRSHQEYPAHIFSASSLQMLEEVRGFLIPPFQSMISASHENLPKRSPESYKEVAFRLGVKPSEMLFIDDSPDVVQAAQAAGVTAIQ
jgi:FMN phosphatase YigB (HAD superfamily)